MVMSRLSVNLTTLFLGKLRPRGKISSTFLVLLSNKMFLIKAGFHKKLVKVANREYPDQTASPEAV